MAERLTVPRETRGAVGEVAEPLLVADRNAAVRAVAQAVDALPTLGREERDHVITGGDERDAVADTLDDTGTLVPEHARRIAGRVGAGSGVEVGMADAAGSEAHEHLARLRLGEIDLLDDERAPELLEDGCANSHAVSIVADSGDVHGSVATDRASRPGPATSVARISRGGPRSPHSLSHERARERSRPRCRRSTDRRRPRSGGARSHGALDRRSRARPPRAEPSSRGR